MPKDSPRESKYGLWYDAAATLQERQWFAAVELGLLCGTPGLAALGVISGLHRPNGLAGDLGGGSLELISVEDGVLGQGVSLDLGGLALRDAAGRNLKKVVLELGGSDAFIVLDTDRLPEVVKDAVGA